VLVKLFRSEMKRNKVVNLTLFTFVMLSSLLASSAIYLTMTLIGGVEELVIKSDTPHFVQMHAGEIDQSDFKEFNERNVEIESFQLHKMLGVPGNEIYLSNNETSEVKSVMDVSLVEQNSQFDYLLNMNNEIAQISKGEIGVPIYYMKDKELSVGDQISFKHNGVSHDYIISTFIRDSQMNPALVSSKRFLLSHEDYLVMEKIYSETEYLIEYKFKDIEDLDGFSQKYQEGKMPSVGPMVDINLFRTINALTDGIVIVVLIFVSFLLTLIAILCLRYTLLSTVEEDIREIGVLKAIGIHHRKIQFIYMAKYLVLTSLASILGYVFSFVVNQILVTNITEYMGITSVGLASYVAPLIGVFMVLSITILSIRIILRRLKKVAVVEAIVGHQKSNKSILTPRLKLSKMSKVHTIFFMSFNKVLVNLKAHILIILIFILSTFIMIVPLNMLTTISSPSFTNYMGVGKSDLRLDIRNHESSGENFDVLLDYIEKDKDISGYGVFKTYGMKVLSNEGEIENIPLEVGDQNSFPLDYIKGSPPKEGELSLSVLAIESIGKNIGDTVSILNNGGVTDVTISGVYQDITNGGKTAKAVQTLSDGNVLWYVINVNLKNDVSIEEKRISYGNQFSNIKVTDLDEYINQTLSGTIKQLRLVAVISSFISCAIGMLITGLFLKMMLAKESREIGILLSIGFNQKNIRVQYMVRMLIVLITGIVFGILLSASLGQNLISMISSSFGASSIRFVVNPYVAYVLLPTLLALVVITTSWLSMNENKMSSISKRLME